MSNKRALGMALEGTKAGSKWIGPSLGTTWVDLTGASFNSIEGGTLASNDVFVTLSVKNRSTSTNLFVLLKAGGTSTSTVAHLLDGGDTFKYSALHGFNAATGVTKISLKAANATDGGYVAFATFVPGS